MELKIKLEALRQLDGMSDCRDESVATLFKLRCEMAAVIRAGARAGGVYLDPEAVIYNVDALIEEALK